MKVDVLAQPATFGAVLAAAALGVAATLAVGPVIGVAGVMVWLLVLVGGFHPTVVACAIAAVVTSNAAAVATDLYGAPPIGALLVPGFIALLLVRRLAGLENFEGAIRVAPALLLYLVVLSLSVIWVEDTEPTIDRLLAVAKDLMMVLAFTGFAVSPPRLRAVVWTIAITISVLSGLSVVQFATGAFESNFLGFAVASIQGITETTQSWRLQGPIGDPNYFAQLLVTFLPLIVVTAFAAPSRWLRLAGLAGAPLTLAAIVLTYSRGALLGVLAMTMFAMLLMRHRLLVLAGAALLGVIGMAVAQDLVIGRIALVFAALQSVIAGEQSVADMALAQRLSVFRAAALMFAESPFLGVGTGQFAHLYPSYALSYGLDLGAPPQAHNRYMEAGAEGGLLGLATLIALIGGVVASGMRSAARFDKAGLTRDAMLVRGLVLGLLGYLATGIFLHAAFERFAALVISLILASATVARPQTGRGGKLQSGQA